MKKILIVSLLFSLFLATNFVWARDVLWPGDKLLPGQQLSSKNARYHLIMRKNGNLELCKDNASFCETPYWQSGTTGKVEEAIMQDDGNFVIYFKDRDPWRIGTDDNINSFLIVQDDGNVVIYKTSGCNVKVLLSFVFFRRESIPFQLKQKITLKKVVFDYPS